jgi:hypothetical protein
MVVLVIRVFFCLNEVSPIYSTVGGAGKIFLLMEKLKNFQLMKSI